MHLPLAAMNSDILFEISKYLERTTGIQPLDHAYESPEVLKQCRQNVSEYLNRKLKTRPSKADLESKNIIRKCVTDFDYIHAVLESIDFRENESRISPRIANLAKKLDFQLKRRMIIRKLGLDKE